MAGHFSLDKTLNHPMARFYWLGSTVDGRRWCAACCKCQLLNPLSTPNEPLHPLPLIKVLVQKNLYVPLSPLVAHMCNMILGSRASCMQLSTQCCRSILPSDQEVVECWFTNWGQSQGGWVVMMSTASSMLLTWLFIPSFSFQLMLKSHNEEAGPESLQKAQENTHYSPVPMLPFCICILLVMVMVFTSV